jgi:hypothetical protein
VNKYILLDAAYGRGEQLYPADSGLRTESRLNSPDFIRSLGIVILLTPKDID